MKGDKSAARFDVISIRVKIGSDIQVVNPILSKMQYLQAQLCSNCKTISPLS